MIKKLELNLSDSELNYILSPQVIRERAQKIFDLTMENKTNFVFHSEKMIPTSDFVLEVIKENYPDLKIPYHSRSNHFQVGGIDRLALLDEKLNDLTPLEQTKSKVDLTMISVLLDAGAGMNWSYQSTDMKMPSSKSEGLALASYFMFLNGDFSSDNEKPYQVDAAALKRFTLKQLEKGFQVSSSNPLNGLEGRVKLINELGKALELQALFKGRPGHLIDELVGSSPIQAETIFKKLLRGLDQIWPDRIQSKGISLGDTWHYSNLSPVPGFNSLIPFHKLTGWLTYSIIDVLESAGLSVIALDQLTGLAEYRNGGLFIDSGLITLKDDSLFAKDHRPDSELIIEWRALTIILLDKVYENVRSKLNFTGEEFPMARVLEGGTWSAGRKLAKKLRNDGGPPLNIISDGTVF